jgi:hypothetical protein
VVPLEDLVEDDPVDEAPEADSQQQAGKREATRQTARVAWGRAAA